MGDDLNPAAREIAAIEASHYGFYRLACERVSGAEFHEDGEFTWASTGRMHPMLNVLLGARLAPDLPPNQLEVKITTALAPFHARQLPFLWFLWPSDQYLGPYLEAHGLVHGASAPGMTCDLTQPLPDLPPVPGLTMALVRDDAAFEQWLATCAAGFGFGEEETGVLYPAFRQVGYAAPFYAWLGLLDGQPVATVTLLLTGDVLGIYNVSTLPEGRRRGIGAAITRAAMQQAQQEGSTRAILLATEMGYPVYARLGFRQCCTVSEYVWMPGAETPAEANQGS